MADDLQHLPERVQAVEQKLEALSVSVDMRFDAVDAAIAEQREYTEFAFDRLANEMRTGFSSVERRFSQIERKLDQFIDTQSKANGLVERRLRALEPPSVQE